MTIATNGAGELRRTAPRRHALHWRAGTELKDQILRQELRELTILFSPDCEPSAGETAELAQLIGEAQRKAMNVQLAGCPPATARRLDSLLDQPVYRHRPLPGAGDAQDGLVELRLPAASPEAARAVEAVAAICRAHQWTEQQVARVRAALEAVLVESLLSGSPEGPRNLLILTIAPACSSLTIDVSDEMPRSGPMPEATAALTGLEGCVVDKLSVLSDSRGRIFRLHWILPAQMPA